MRGVASSRAINEVGNVGHPGLVLVLVAPEHIDRVRSRNYLVLLNLEIEPPDESDQLPELVGLRLPARS